MSASVLLGCQGWQYSEWVGPLYQDDLDSSEMLRVYAEEFDTVEVGDTFRGIPPLSLIRTWRDAVPEGFRFAFKVPQQVSHERRFSGTERLLDRFTRHVSVVGRRLGPLLICMSPGFSPTQETRATFVRFIASLPRGFQWAVEFRRHDWILPDVVEALERRGVALVLVEGRWLAPARVMDLAVIPTASFTYVRWNDTSRRRGDDHGAAQSETARSDWLGVLRDVSGSVEEVYGYFNNRFTGHAPDDVRGFLQGLGQIRTGIQD
jgi:uncharacterized protein YecE (DUF72 family)